MAPQVNKNVYVLCKVSANAYEVLGIEILAVYSKNAEASKAKKQLQKSFKPSKDIKVEFLIRKKPFYE